MDKEDRKVLSKYNEILSQAFLPKPQPKPKPQWRDRNGQAIKEGDRVRVAVIHPGKGAMDWMVTHTGFHQHPAYTVGFAKTRVKVNFPEEWVGDSQGRTENVAPECLVVVNG